MNASNIQCPKCQHEFEISQALQQRLEARIKADYEQRAEQAVAEARKQAAAEAFARWKKEHQGTLDRLQAEAREAQLENKQLRDKELAFLKKERQLKQQQEELELEIERQLQRRLEQTRVEVQKAAEERYALRLREKDKMLEDQKKLVAEMQRKAEQGSMQMQGEVMELALEDWLISEFPFDQVEEVKKGARGADVRQTVRDRQGQACGRMLYETKRTKRFSEGWITKLKDDLREQGADLAVLVTEAMPADMPHFGERQGVWICSFQELPHLIPVLRTLLVRVAAAYTSQENKGEKMHLLYDYLTGPEFRQQVEAIVEGFTTMKGDLDKEKRAMQRAWKQREKQIERVLQSTVEMYGAIQGIGGQAIAPIRQLELPGGE